MAAISMKMHWGKNQVKPIQSNYLQLTIIDLV